MAFIYALCDPDTMEIRYIGKANNMQRRFASHLQEAKRKSRPVQCWIWSLVQSGRKPVMTMLEESQDWAEAERRQIAKHKVCGRLLNLAPGGDEPFCTKEQRQSNAKKMLAHPNTLENRRTQGSAQLRRIQQDPIKLALRGILQRLSLMANDMRDMGATQTETKLRSVIDRMRVKFKAEPELMYYRLVQHPRWRGMMHMSKQEQKETELWFNAA